MKVLIVVDAQVDFISRDSGALPVPGALSALPHLRELVETHSMLGDTIVATRDWHPSNHCSFRENGGEWPRHCVRGTYGAMIDRQIYRYADYVVSKGRYPDLEEYEGFSSSLRALRSEGIWRVESITIAGFALDVCVYHTAKRAIESHHTYGATEVILETKACAGISEEDVDAKMGELEDLGVKVR